MPYESNGVKIGCVVLAVLVSKSWGHKKRKLKIRDSDISPICPDAPNGAIILISARGVILILC